jgi:uncharacterized membrane protein YccC
MDGARRMISPGLVLIILGIITISRFTVGVRHVAVVGLTGGGFAIGMGIAFLIFPLLQRRAARRES